MSINVTSNSTKYSPKAGRLRHKWLLLGHEELLLLLHLE